MQPSLTTVLISQKFIQLHLEFLPVQSKTLPPVPPDMVSRKFCRAVSPRALYAATAVLCWHAPRYVPQSVSLDPVRKSNSHPGLPLPSWKETPLC
jgi:hypothetical protein